MSKLDAETMRLYMQLGQLVIKKKHVDEQISEVERKLSAINECMPLISSPLDKKEPKHEGS